MDIEVVRPDENLILIQYDHTAEHADWFRHTVLESFGDKDIANLFGIEQAYYYDDAIWLYRAKYAQPFGEHNRIAIEQFVGGIRAGMSGLKWIRK